MMQKKKKLRYWQQRLLQIAIDRDKKDLAYIQQMNERYDSLSNAMYKKIQYWISLYADNEGISREEAYETLAKNEQRTWLMDLSEFRQKAIDGGYDQELNREYFRSRISRLEHLERQLYFELADHANKEAAYMAAYLKGQLNDTYLSAIYELTDRGGFNVSFERYDFKSLEVAISKPWKGNNFSGRVWKNHLETLPDKLSDVLSESVIQGIGIDETVNRMMHGIDKSLRNRMITLVQTESAHLADVATGKAMDELEVNEWEWLATLEIHTCDICASYDSKTATELLEEFGFVPECPDHPNCRCCRIPIIPGWKSSTRWQRDPVTGKGSIQKHQTFTEWKIANVTPEVEQQLKIERNRRKDEKQYKDYRAVIGRENMPDSLADFIDLKYNDSSGWERLTDNFFVKSRLNDNRLGSQINLEKQAPHIAATVTAGKSYFGDDINVQELFDKYAGTGRLEKNRNGRTHKEIVHAPDFEGVAVSLDSTRKTNTFKIHHSKKRTHIVPIKGRGDQS